jgi:hypothetical protein
MHSPRFICSRGIPGGLQRLYGIGWRGALTSTRRCADQDSGVIARLETVVGSRRAAKAAERCPSSVEHRTQVCDVPGLDLALGGGGEEPAKVGQKTELVADTSRRCFTEGRP